MTRLDNTLFFIFARRLAVNDGNGCVKKNARKLFYFYRKKVCYTYTYVLYLCYIYKRKQHNKDHIDWIKNEITREFQSFLYIEKKKLFKNVTQNTYNIKEKK